MEKEEPSVGTDKLNEAPAAPSNVMNAWNWRGSAAGAADAKPAAAARREKRVNAFISTLELL